MSYPRRSPVHASIAGFDPEWCDRFGMTVALRFGNPDEESKGLEDLALIDVSALPRIGCKGPGAADWLQAQGVTPPPEIYGWNLPQQGGLVVRVDTHEFLIEDGLRGGISEDVSAALGQGGDGTFRIERQDASIWLTGKRALDVFAQTCSFEIEAIGDAFIKTRVALTSCSVKREDVGRAPGYRLWFEPSYGEYLYGALMEIAQELGGGPVGWECLERAAGI